MKKAITKRRAQGYAGFTLIEMLVVLAIISILLLSATPSTVGKYNKIHIQESAALVSGFKTYIAQYYALNESFPTDNEQAGIPAPNLITGNYLAAVYVENGALHLELGNKAHATISGKTLTIRPVFVPESTQTPLSWVCGYDSIPDNMVSPEGNQTDVNRIDLPVNCL